MLFPDDNFLNPRNCFCSMVLDENAVRQRLKAYTIQDIYFLKSKWRRWIYERQFQRFIEEEKKPNIVTVYDILVPEKIVSITAERNDFYAVRTKHSPGYDVVVIIKNCRV